VRNRLEPSALIYICGEPGVGKSCCFSRLTTTSYPTNGLSNDRIWDYSTDNVDTKPKIKIGFWDLSGKIKNTQVLTSLNWTEKFTILVFDITQRNSFEELKYWNNLSNTKGATKLILIGNKSDLEDKRAVTEEEAQKFAADNGMKYFETSAQNNTGFKEAQAYFEEKIIRVNQDKYAQKPPIMPPRETSNQYCNFFLNVFINAAIILTGILPYILLCILVNRNFNQENKRERGSYFKFCAELGQNDKDGKENDNIMDELHL